MPILCPFRATISPMLRALVLLLALAAGADAGQGYCVVFESGCEAPRRIAVQKVEVP